MPEQIPVIPSGVYSSGVLAGKKKTSAAAKKQSSAIAQAKASSPGYIRAQIAKWRAKIKNTPKTSRYYKGWQRYLKMLEGRLKNIGG